uniref:Uncharacterized protein n=1 Tax=Cucumis melo TaxID=3656 RepID=A0A9I9EKM6_CUCME
MLGLKSSLLEEFEVRLLTYDLPRLLQNNNISDPIPIELGTVPLLQTLDLSNNRFSDWFMWSILGGPLFKLIVVDWFKVDKSFDDIELHPRNLVQQAEQSVQESTTTFEELARVQNHPPGTSAAELVISITKTQTEVELIL